MLLCWCATPLRAATLTDLNERARNQGSVRVIVKLAVDPVSPGVGLAPVNAIGDAHDRLVGQLGDGVMRAQRFRQLPFSVLQVNAVGLAALTANPLVAAIEEDRLSPPLLDLSTVRINADDVWAGYRGRQKPSLYKSS